jgi:polyphosphate kinase
VLVVRREGDGVRNYVHIGTGNYHSATARLYTDFGLFTTDEAIGADVAELFNYLTGFGRPPLPQGARRAELPARRRSSARSIRRSPPTRRSSPARIAMKMNALVDGPASTRSTPPRRRGVRVDLNVRGICCLRPGLPGLGEHPRRLDRRAPARALARVLVQRGGECRRSTSPPPT